MPERIIAWTEANGLYAIGPVLGGALGYVSHFLGLDLLIGRLWGEAPANAMPWGAIIGAVGGLLVVVASGLFKLAMLRITHRHERAMKELEYSHAEALRDKAETEARRLRVRLVEKGFSPEDSDVDGED